MAYRSEADRVPNKQTYQDLNLTHYPGKLDTRLNNLNMRGFVNVGEEAVPDYVMAEYVNAALDGVMALERALGVNPMVSTRVTQDKIIETINTQTVSDRIAAIEGGNLDERYGGAGWKYVPNRPTLNNHNHDGLNGHPGKIDLQTEVENKLRKANIDLTLATGLTGSDIFVSNTRAVSIADALNDALSKTYGGTVLAKVNFNKGIRSLTTIEMLASEFNRSGGITLATDNTANFNQTARAGGTAAGTLHTETLTNNLMYGQYVLGFRAKVNTVTNTPVIRVTTGTKTSTFNANEFDAVNKYQTMYHVFEHNGQETLTISKLALSFDVQVSMDSFYIHPIHPAVFDR